ncbi:hypothetical protein IKG73_03610 [Candidatus Saccharibacteria bacterium]|nr:hypothetical protein [Candidatus Saccharibacteria bacterium]
MADIKQIAEKIQGAKNILVALSQNPNVDEVSAALGLTLMLDKLGKKATAIYSGETPAMLKFLSPEKTFSTDTNALQDFIISLDKEKADHLRYKVDGDFVKVFITPYHEAISENDLEYSYGEFNVDLIIALDVADERELDSALVEYGRIMHDAGAVNITTHEGGKFSDTEWSNPEASSVSEMVAELGTELSPEAFEKNSATALLTGIVASTERFANEKTTPETMGVAAKLMGAGADQRLIAENIKRAESGQEQEPFSEGTSSSEDALLSRRMSNTPHSVAPSSDASRQTELPRSVESASASNTRFVAPSSNFQSENDSEESVKEEPVEEKIGEEPIKETPEEPEMDLQKVAEMTKEESEKSETETETEPEPEKPVLETPSELLESEPFSEGTPKTEDAKLEEVKPEETPEAEKPELEEAPKVEESEEAPKAEELKPEEGSEPEEEKSEPEEVPRAEEPEPEEAPKVELKGASGEKVEDTRRKTVTLQPSEDVKAELEEIMKEEPKKNEALDEINKYTGDQAVSGGLKPDVGLSSIDTDNIGKREVKDYSEMMAEALGGDEGMPNPAVQAAPAVANGPEANHIPEMDYSQASSMPAEQPPVMENGMLESVNTEKPAGAAVEGMTAATEPSNLAPGTTAASEGMTEDILPPPPAPPVDGAMMPPAAPAAPASTPEPAPEAPVTSAPATNPVPVQPVIPVVPTVPEAPAAPEAPATPEAPAAPVAPAPTEAPTQVGPTPTNDDPAAFRIPGI